MTENYDNQFQKRVDELLFLEQRADERAKEWVNINRQIQQQNQQSAADFTAKMTHVNDSLKKISAASNSIHDYMAQCAKHAERTRHVFMCTLAACVIVIACTLWWSHNLKNNLAKDINEFKNLEFVLKNEPVLKRVNGQDYVRIVERSETSDLYGKNGDVINGSYAKVWHK